MAPKETKISKQAAAVKTSAINFNNTRHLKQLGNLEVVREKVSIW
jgi:hypothetical protein